MVFITICNSNTWYYIYNVVFMSVKDPAILKKKKLKLMKKIIPVFPSYIFKNNISNFLMTDLQPALSFPSGTASVVVPYLNGR